MNALYSPSVAAADIAPLLRPLLRRYATEMLPGERFGDFLIRAGYVTPTGAPRTSTPRPRSATRLTSRAADHVCTKRAAYPRRPVCCADLAIRNGTK